MEVNTYLNFDGQCEDAFKFYEQCLGGQMGPIFRYGESPMAGTVSPEWQDKVMHGSLIIGSHVLMGADVPPRQFEHVKGFSLSVQIASPDEADRIFQALAENGQVVLPLEQTFWAERFGMVVDRFGIPWMINCGESSRPVDQMTYVNE
jgi:PhnB protein